MRQLSSSAPGRESTAPDREHVPYVVLTNFVAPYRAPVFAHLRTLLPGTEIWASADTESDRVWSGRDLNGLPGAVRVQRSWTWCRPGRQGAGTDLHIPWDTLPRLFRARPRAVLSGELGFRTLFCATYKVFRPRTRLVIWATVSERTERNRGPVRALVRRRLLAVADAVVVNGESGRRYIRTLTDHPVYVVPQAAPAVDRPARPRPVGARLSIVYVGNLVAPKGLRQMVADLDRWLAVRNRTAELTLIGHGPERDRLAALGSDRLHVRLTGHLPYEQTLASYAEHDAMIFPTLWDEWGLVVNEALQAGCPVIGSVHSQAVESLIRPGVNGFHYDPEVSGSLSTALDAFTAAISRVPGELTENARRSVASNTPETMAAGLAAALTDHPAGETG
ncbi:MAG: glycosyltransferase family 4 protein [Kineosporiaceae bacterium]